MDPATDEEAAESALPQAAPQPEAPSKAAAERWSERPAAELERLLEEQPSHPDKEAVAAALAAKWKEHYLRVARAPAETSGTVAPPAAPASRAAGADWRVWLRDRVFALRKRLAELLAPPAEPPKGSSQVVDRPPPSGADSGSSSR